jgi:hypothetical protein
MATLRVLLAWACLDIVSAVDSIDCEKYPGPIRVVFDVGSSKYDVKMFDIATSSHIVLFSVPKSMTVQSSPIDITRMDACGINPMDSILYCLVSTAANTFFARITDHGVKVVTGGAVVADAYSGSFDEQGQYYYSKMLADNILDAKQILTIGGGPIAHASSYDVAQQGQYIQVLSASMQDTQKVMMIGGALGGTTDKTAIQDWVTLQADFGAGSTWYALAVYYGSGGAAAPKVAVIGTVGQFSLNTVGGPEGMNTASFNAGWIFNGRVFFSHMDGGGIFEVHLGSIKVSGAGSPSTVTLERIADDKTSTNFPATTMADGANCMKAYWPPASNTTTNTTTPMGAPSAVGGGAAATTTTSNTTITTTSTRYRQPLNTSAGGIENATGPNGMLATKIPVLDNSAFTLGDFVRISESTWFDEGYIVAFGSIIIQPPAQNTYSSAAVVTVITSAAPTSAAAGNDPLVTYGKESREFWLPVGKLTPIIHTHHLNMLASTFVGSPREQWMDRIVVTNADGFRLADIRIKKNLNAFDRNKTSRDAFETIDLTLGMAQTPLKTLPKDLPGGNKKVFSRMDVSVVVERLNKVFAYNTVPFHLDQTNIGRARREAIIISSPHARFLVISSPATEYYGDLRHLSIEYAHLDLHILDMTNRASIRGLLPELWGLKKMSNRTKELTCPPWSKDAPQTKEGVDVDAEWNSRFFQV